MSEPKRYTFEAKEILDSNGMVCSVGVATLTHPMGKFVSYEDYDRLKAQIERLTNAGDCLVIHIEACYRAEGYDPKDCDMIDNWNAVKEVQS